MSSPEAAGSPGKTRTWWHPLLVTVLEHDLLPAFEVRDEVSVGTLPLRADIVLVRRGEAETPDRARRSFRALAERLNHWTLIEFKSPVDSLERGDLARLIGISCLFIAQQPEVIAASEMSLVILAPSVTKAFQAEVQQFGLRLLEDEPGIWRIEGGLFTTWLLELDRLAPADEPALAIFSSVFLRDRQLIMDMVRDPDTQPMMRYVFQQIRQFQQRGEAFMIQHTHTAEMDQEYAAFMEAFMQSLTPEHLAALPADAAFKEAFVQSLTPEDLVALSPEERLAGLSPEERLAGLSPEARVSGLSPHDLLHALTPEKRKWLIDLLRQTGDVGANE
jgi:hypothetical protein